MSANDIEWLRLTVESLKSKSDAKEATIADLADQISVLRAKIEINEDTTFTPSPSPVSPDEPDEPILAKIGAEGSGTYAGTFAWQQAMMNGSNTPTVITSGGLSVTASQPGTAIQLPTGYSVLMPFHMGNKAQWVMLGAPPGFYLIKQNGGAAGSTTATITATYDIFALSDTGYTTALNGSTPLSPEMNRAWFSGLLWTIGVAAAGTIGTACQDNAGTWHLLTVQETPDWSGC